MIIACVIAGIIITAIFVFVAVAYRHQIESWATVCVAYPFTLALAIGITVFFAMIVKDMNESYIQNDTVIIYSEDGKEFERYENVSIRSNSNDKGEFASITFKKGDDTISVKTRNGSYIKVIYR